MKKLLLIILILLPCELGAQEGCGEWIRPEADIGMDVIDGSVLRIYTFKYESWKKIDSVWVRTSCPDTAIGAWYWEFAIKEIDLYIRIRADTLWQVGDSVWIESLLYPNSMLIPNETKYEFKQEEKTSK